MKKLGLTLAVTFALGLMMALLGAWTATYDTTTPAGTDSPSIIDDRIRETKLGVQERQNVDHYWPLSGSQVSDADAGKHRKITFQEALATKPTLTDGQLALYTKLTDSNEAIWLESEAGTERQLTTGSGLALKLVDADGAVLKSGAQTIAGVKTFSSAPLSDANAVEPNELVRYRQMSEVDVNSVNGLHIEKYDSGWFGAASNTTYTKAHGLSGIPWIVQLWWSNTWDGTGDVVKVGSPDFTYMVYDYTYNVNLASNICDLDATNIKIRTSDALLTYTDANGNSHVAISTGYFRIFAVHIY